LYSLAARWRSVSQRRALFRRFPARQGTPAVRWLLRQWQEMVTSRHTDWLHHFTNDMNHSTRHKLHIATNTSYRSTGTLNSSPRYFTTDSQSVSQRVCLGIEYPCGTCHQILFPVGMLLSEICGLVSVWHPLWREDESAICSVIAQWSESLRTRNHILLSHLRLSQPGGPGSRIYIPQEQGGPVIPSGTGFPLRRLLRLAGLRWRYSNPPPPGGTTTDRRLHIGTNTSCKSTGSLNSKHRQETTSR
jgi:hypothetical protein